MNLQVVEKLVDDEVISSSKKELCLIKLEKEVVIGYLPKFTKYDKIGDLLDFLNSEVQVLTKEGSLISIQVAEILDLEKITSQAEFANFLSYYKKNLITNGIYEVLFEDEFDLVELKSYLLKKVNLVKLLEIANKQIGETYLFFQISFNFISNLRKAYEKTFRADFKDELIKFANEKKLKEIPFYWIYETADKNSDVLNKALADFLVKNKSELEREDEIIKALLEVVDEEVDEPLVVDEEVDEQFNPQMEIPDEMAKPDFDEVQKEETEVEPHLAERPNENVYKNWAD